MLEIDTEFADGNVATEVVLVNTTEGAQEFTHRRPHTFGSVDMHLTDAIAVIIARPFLLAVTDRRVRANDVMVALPFVGVYLSIGPGEGMDMVNQRLFVSVVNHSQACLSALTSHSADNGRPIIVIGAVSPQFVDPPAGRIIWVRMKITFSPAF